MKDTLAAYKKYLMEEEKSDSTCRQYLREAERFAAYLAGRELTKEAVVAYKAGLVERYTPASVNTKLAAVNGYLAFLGRDDMKVKRMKIQRSPYCSEDRELKKEEYRKMVETAEKSGDERTALILQTIAATGIRVSELRFITMEAVRQGEAVVTLKGKTRVILLPRALTQKLMEYADKRGINKGPVFVTGSGRPVDRSWVWRAIKRIGRAAGIEAKKVFPHNLRHLFARMFYENCRDIVKLADVLGHSSINTSRIYTVSSGREHRKLVEETGLVW